MTCVYVHVVHQSLVMATVGCTSFLLITINTAVLCGTCQNYYYLLLLGSMFVADRIHPVAGHPSLLWFMALS